MAAVLNKIKYLLVSFNVYELDRLWLDLHKSFALIDRLFGAVKVT